jgi:hypothetical protein
MVTYNNPNLSYKTDTALFTITPTMMGIASFTPGDYYFEIRMIGKKETFIICAAGTIGTTPTPTPTPTPSHTPTPTPTPTHTVEYDLYYADEYSCETCTIVSEAVIVALPSGTSPNYGNFYVPQYITGFTYVLQSTTLTGPGLILSTSNYNTCGAACGSIPPTPTPVYSTFSVKVNTLGFPTICSVSPITVYVAYGDTITTGTELFSNSSLSSPLIGYDYITEDSGSGDIFEIGSGTAVIGINTGTFC